MPIRFESKQYGEVIFQEQMLLRKMEYAQIKRKIEVLATFMPNEVLRSAQMDTSTQHYIGVLLLVKISGITSLAEKYNKIGNGGIFRLTATLNAYIGALIEVLLFYGGDVIKSAQETYLTLWKVKSEDTLCEILHEVMVCALVIQERLGNFQTEINIPLKLKLAIICGNVSFVIVGSNKCRDYILFGDALMEVQVAQEYNHLGDVIIVSGGWTHMLQDRYEVSNTDSGSVKVHKVIYKPNEYAERKHYEEKKSLVLNLVEKHMQYRQLVHSKDNYGSDVTDVKLNDTLIQSLPPRQEVKQASRHWMVDELQSFLINVVQNQVEESQHVEYLTQIIEATVQCIRINLSVVYTNQFVNIIRACFKAISDVVGKYLGDIYKVWLMHNDVMVVVIFGLRGINQKLECQNSLRCAFSIRSMLLNIRGVSEVLVANSSGYLYSGVIGHPLRREYAIIGATVIKAEKLMSSYRNKVVCDYKTFKNSKLSSFYFLQLNAKERDASEVVFCYNEEYEAIPRSFSVVRDIVGRKRETDMIKSVIYRQHEMREYSGVCFEGPTKIGKSAILASSINTLNTSHSAIVASVELESGSDIPYFCISKLYRQLYDIRAQINSKDLTVILNMPRNIRDYCREDDNPDVDIAYRKYRILNYFRDITVLTTKKMVIFIDNVEYIDLQSWEILEIILGEKHVTLIMTACFEVHNWDLRFKMSLNDNIKLTDIPPLEPKHVPNVACMLLASEGIRSDLAELLKKSCKGRSGYIQSYLLRMINERNIEFKLIAAEDMDNENYVFPRLKEGKHGIVQIVEYCKKYTSKNASLTLAAITLDLFSSFSHYEKLVIKTGAVLGNIFSRTLLKIALNHLPESTITRVVQQLFEKDIFDCGSRYLHPQQQHTDRLCCRCYFSETKNPEAEEDVPKYAKCKIMHFKNTTIKDIAYKLLPDNQRKDLHLLCTDILEYMIHLCPKCLQEKSNGFVQIMKYKNFLSSCNKQTQPKTTYYSHTYNNEDIKNCIRKYFASPKDATTFEEHGKLQLDIFNVEGCNCFEIHSRVYKDLIYHSQCAEHARKRIFFTVQYAFILICMYDYTNAIASFTEARELCMANTQVSDTSSKDLFDRLHLGRIYYGLAMASMDLQQIQAAKNYLCIALRQYYIPSVAMTYKHFNELLVRSYLINVKNDKGHIYKNNISRNELGMCLALCGKLFVLEGNWSLAKMACTYSIFILKSNNENIAMLLDVYCTAMDISKYCDDIHVCIKLQKFVSREILVRYAHDLTPNLYWLNVLLINIFQILCMSGDTKKSIRMGYRILDITLHIFYRMNDYKIVIWLAILLLYNFRVKDAADICILFKKNCAFSSDRSLVIYNSFHMYLHLSINFAIECIDDIIHFVDNRRNLGKTPRDDYDYLLFTLVRLHYIRSGKYQMGDDYKYEYNFSRTNTNKDVVMVLLIVAIEIHIYTFLRSIQNNSVEAMADGKLVCKMLKLCDQQTKRLYKIFRPNYFIFHAWYNKIKKEHKKSEKSLNEALKLCDKQNNVLYKSWIIKLQHVWKDGFVSRTNKHTNILLTDAHYNLSLIEWTRQMTTLPIE